MHPGLVCTLLLVAALGACGYSDPSAGPPAGTDVRPSGAPAGDDFNAGAGKKPTVMGSGLQYVDLQVGTGPVATAGSEVAMQYTGWLTDGTKFDSSRDQRGEPFKLTIGEGAVIKGWEEGIPGMRVGGRRRLIVPPTLGYGTQVKGQIPANSTLIFALELVSVTPKASPSPSSSPTS